MRVIVVGLLIGTLLACGRSGEPRDYRDVETSEIFEALPCAVMNANWEMRRSDEEKARIRLCERSRHVAATREMLANGADPVALRGRFLEAAARGRYDSVVSAMRLGIHLDTVYCGNEGDGLQLTALTRAREAGYVELADFLNESGAATSNEDRLADIMRKQWGAVEFRKPPPPKPRGTLPPADAARAATYDACFAPPEERHLALMSGADLTYSIYGVGSSALIFVHDEHCDADCWGDAPLAFSGEHVSVAIDIPGSGEPDVDGGGTLRAVARDVDADRIVVVADWRGRDRLLEQATDNSDPITGFVFIRHMSTFAAYDEGRAPTVPDALPLPEVCVNVVADGPQIPLDFEMLRMIEGCPSVTISGVSGPPFVDAFSIAQFVFYEALRRTGIHP